MHSHDRLSLTNESLYASTIKVQSSVMERLNFEDQMDYVGEGYNEECRRLLNTDEEVRDLLEEGELEPAATLLTQKLIAWKPVKKQKKLAA